MWIITNYDIQPELVARQLPPAPQQKKNLLSCYQELCGTTCSAPFILYSIYFLKGVLFYDKTSACAKSNGFGC